MGSRATARVVYGVPIKLDMDLPDDPFPAAMLIAEAAGLTLTTGGNAVVGPVTYFLTPPDFVEVVEDVKPLRLPVYNQTQHTNILKCARRLGVKKPTLRYWLISEYG